MRRSHVFSMSFAIFPVPYRREVSAPSNDRMSAKLSHYKVDDGKTD
jgi:hypothetical protein